MSWLLIRSNLVTPKENLNIFIHPPLAVHSTSCCLFGVTFSNPYIMTGLSLHPSRVSCVIDHTDTFFHQLHPAWICFFTSLRHSPLLWTYARKCNSISRARIRTHWLWLQMMYLLFNTWRKVEFGEDLSSLSILKAHREKSHIFSRVQCRVLGKEK